MKLEVHGWGHGESRASKAISGTSDSALNEMRCHKRVLIRG